MWCSDGGPSKRCAIRLEELRVRGPTTSVAGVSSYPPEATLRSGAGGVAVSAGIIRFVRA